MNKELKHYIRVFCRDNLRLLEGLRIDCKTYCENSEKRMYMLNKKIQKAKSVFERKQLNDLYEFQSHCVEKYVAKLEQVNIEIYEYEQLFAKNEKS